MELQATVEPHIKKVVIVDDNEDITEVLGDALRSKGYTVIAFNDSREVLPYLDALSFEDLPDYILLDYEMPFLDGAKLHYLMTQCPRLANIHTLVMSGAAPEDLLRAFAGMPVDFMRKPFELKQLDEMFH